MLSDCAETNFCPSLNEIATSLRLSPNVAGVTFLALGNGAPDISSIVAGVLLGSSGFGIGEPIGAGVFVCTAVVALCTLLAPVYVNPISFLRDVIVYFVAVVFVLIVCLTGEFKLWQSLVCLLIYFAYVVLVFSFEKLCDGCCYWKFW